ncbi:glycosyltransferase family 32 protein [Actibacterium sp. XHP0104]|uniref:glycosyltransferase family 32 protein n=1 Tax=Actibacterium sp. XHP0104 TaxID=2984335 RepID=UPI0021E811D3|nr:glycosyltransferase [Actibacterium sp. XHP0104]MCV2881837.1 glycosyltransferase [Actibacterium sp. XHP0104]
MPQIQPVIPPRAKTDWPNPNIPPLLHQTFKSNELPERMHEAAMSWVEKNPGFTYHFHDDDAQISLIRDNFDPEVLAAYHKIKSGAFRADFWRYCQLWTTGGVYADIDTVCQVNLEQIIRPDDQFVVPLAGFSPTALFNAFICSAPKHPFLERAIHQATETIHRNPNFDGYGTVGPGGLGAAVNHLLGRDKSTPFPIGTHEFADSTFRVITRQNGQDNLPGHVRDGENIVFYIQYDGYLDDLAQIGVEHWLHGKRLGLRAKLRRLVRRIHK